MSLKRKRKATAPNGLAPGQVLKRSTLDSHFNSPWAWVGSEVTNKQDITQEHRLATCGLTESATRPFCANKYAQKQQTTRPKASASSEDDVIVISEDEKHVCTRTSCKNNPNCLNYLGQDLWEDEDTAKVHFLQQAKLGENPLARAREPGIPVGLKNLGATCYANASLQVWFRNSAFRAGVYSCQPVPGESEETFKSSPIYQLQTTFAALQESIESVFDPTKLVESLRLSTTEQQDAQEFSKLFISHLDAEFQKQPLARLKTLVKDQFQGLQVYGTLCETCKSRSERDTDFSEIEINFGKNAKLEDSIASLLKPEKLSGDNMYYCSACDGLQEATRYTEYRTLPPVLHFSLMRFVFDFNSMERKKSKNSISFPTTLNMGVYIGSTETRRASSAGPSSDNVYELRGILLHKGSSAYHGHYEAQVRDPSAQSWFQFNDEVVTQVTALGDTKRAKTVNVIDLVSDDEDKPVRPSQRSPNNAKKKRRIEDSDDEAKTQKPHSPAAHEITSKDAYMLVYVRKSSDVCPTEEAPPSPLLDTIKSSNTLYDAVCKEYSLKETQALARFAIRRRHVIDIYQSWSATYTSEDYGIVSREALEKWLSQHSIETVLSAADTPETAGPLHIPIKGILCAHGLLDHHARGSMKRISQRALSMILQHTGCAFLPRMGRGSVCAKCVEANFVERLYQIEHPKQVAQYDQLEGDTDNQVGYWISKLWLKDWRLNKPKSHTVSEEDPGPEAPDYDTHIRCEHGELTLNATNRCRVSLQRGDFIKSLFPQWVPILLDQEPCETCISHIQMTKGERLELRKKAEDEKGNLKFMFEHALTGDMQFLENVSCALVPATFVRAWKRWILKPTETARPESVDNVAFFCEHNKLAYDPNCQSDLEDVAIIKRMDWDFLMKAYGGGPLISIERYVLDDVPTATYMHEVGVCTPCRSKRLSDWESTEIIIRICGRETSDTAPLGRNAAGARQSKRLLQVKRNGEKRRITIEKATSVKDIKVKLQSELNMTTICQRLFYRGVELLDNNATAESLSLLAGDTIDLREELEGPDKDAGSQTRKHEEGNGFGGTLLSGSSLATMPKIEPPPPTASTEAQAEALSSWSCPACTFENSAEALGCTLCNTLFIV